MRTLVAITLLIGAALAQDDQTFVGPSFSFNCPEPNGLFADAEQCDLYYVCVDGKATAELCDDGLLFDDSVRNKERCVLPYSVDCGARTFVQEPATGIDPRCPHANGFFDHEDPNVCDRFYNCDKGTVYEMPCPPSLMFDVGIGNCVTKDLASPDARICETDEEAAGNLKTIEGFTCPGKEAIGPNGLLQAHPVFPHPTDCRHFFTCFFGKEPNKFGCSKGQVFDALSLTCKGPEDVDDCACWYECGEDSKCPDSCNADCSCPIE